MKTLGEMSAGMAHELNQPLNAIRMGSEFLEMMVERGTIEQDHLTQVVREISVQVDRASEIINTLREFCRKGDLHRERLDLNKSIRSVLRLVDRQLVLQNIDVRLDLDESIRPILAQNNRFQQVMFNLLLNARDAIVKKQESDPDGERRISIRTYGGNGQVAVAVADTGTGIPDADRDKIFEPFYTTKQTGQGMGLGLSISYGIVKDFGGQIVVLASGGEGTTFELSFPAST
jgi:histidine kinase